MSDAKSFEKKRLNDVDDDDDEDDDFFIHSCSDGVNDMRHRVQRQSVTARRRERIPDGDDDFHDHDAEAGDR